MILSRRLPRTLILLSVLLAAVILISPETQEPANSVLTILTREGVSGTQREGEELARFIVEVSREYMLDPLLVLAIIKVESSFKVTARSSKGAWGLLQVRPIAVREIERQIGQKVEQKSLLDPHFNIRIGVHYFSYLVERFGGNLWKALMAYNKGPTTVARLYGGRAVPSRGYQAKVMKFYKRFRDELRVPS